MAGCHRRYACLGSWSAEALTGGRRLRFRRRQRGTDPAIRTMSTSITSLAQRPLPTGIRSHRYRVAFRLEVGSIGACHGRPRRPANPRHWLRKWLLRLAHAWCRCRCSGRHRPYSGLLHAAPCSTALVGSPQPLGTAAWGRRHTGQPSL